MILSTMPGSGSLISVPWFLPSTGIIGTSSRSSAQGLIVARETGRPPAPIGVRVRSMVIRRVFRPQPAHRTVPSVPGSLATLESPS